MSEKNLTASFIIEMLGRPAEHLNESLEKFVEELGKEKGVKVLDKNIHEAKELERPEQKEGKKKDIQVREKLFTAFAEIEAEFEKIEHLMMAAFKYMPANIEILSPSKMVLENRVIGELLTGLILKLHRYDEVTKKLVMENQMIGNKLRELAAKYPNEFPKQKIVEDKPGEEISKPEEELVEDKKEEVGEDDVEDEDGVEGNLELEED